MTITTELAAPKQPNGKPPTLRQRLVDPAILRNIGMALPRHMTPERMARVAMTALTRTPKLAECEEASFFKCLFDLSQWGLEPDGYHAHLIPFRNNKREVMECQLIIDYKGYVKLAFQSGQVKAIHADVVHSGDLFAYDRGLVKHHTPWFLRTDAERPPAEGEIIAVYCYVSLKDGAEKSEVLSLEQVKKIRSRSKSRGDGPWVTDWEEMAKKSAFRRVRKWIPLSAELQEAMARDEEFEQLRTVSADPPAAIASGLDDLAGHIEQTLAPKRQAIEAKEEPSEPAPQPQEAPTTLPSGDATYEAFRQSLARQKTVGARGDVLAEAAADGRLSENQMQLLGMYAEDLAAAK